MIKYSYDFDCKCELEFECECMRVIATEAIDSLAVIDYVGHRGDRRRWKVKS